MKKESGFTLVELMVVVSITVLLLAWGIPSFSTWNNKHGIESQMVQLYNDLQFGRMTGYGSKVVSGVWWGGGGSITSYQIRSDANNNGVIDDTGTDTQIGPTVILKYAITPSVNQNSVSFDGRGFLNPAPIRSPSAFQRLRGCNRLCGGIEHQNNPRKNECRKLCAKIRGIHVTTNPCDKRGFTLIEVLVTLMILAFGMLASVIGIMAALDHSLMNEMRNDAMKIAQEQEEAARNMPYANIQTISQLPQTITRQVRNRLVNLYCYFQAVRYCIGRRRHGNDDSAVHCSMDV